MRIIHTSDWHLGRTLNKTRRRHGEFLLFFDWLIEVIKKEKIDVLLLAGDVFDNGNPGNTATALYYSFLNKLSNLVRHVVIIGGNHDSPSFLGAPGELLKALNIHVIGGMTEKTEDMVIGLYDQDDQLELIVCGVPFLRDRDVRGAEEGENIDEKEIKLYTGIKDKYQEIGLIAEKLRKEFGKDTLVPIIGMGHLFVRGGLTVDGDGVRDLYVGSLMGIGTEIFPKCFDYTALGHLHIPQKAGGSDNIRYSGSPLAMGFNEAGQKKSLCILSSHGNRIEVREEEIPVFIEMEKITGNLEEISNRINVLISKKSKALVSVVYSSDEIVANLREKIEEMLKGSLMELVMVKNEKLYQETLRERGEIELASLSEIEVFDRCLSAYKVPEDRQVLLRKTFYEILASLSEEDSRKYQ